MYRFLLIFSLIMAAIFSSQASVPVLAMGCPSIDTNRNNPSGLNNTIDLNKIEYKTKSHFQYSIQLNLPVEMIDNLILYQFISEWVGTKYRYGGCSKSGTDCSGFTQQLLKNVYCIEAGRSVTDQFSQCQPIERPDLQTGDLLFFHTTRPGLSHVGLYLGNDKFVHSGCKNGVVIEDLNSDYYSKAFRTGGRMNRQD